MRHALFKVLFVAAVVGIAVPSYAIVLVHDTWQDGTRTDPAAPVYSEDGTDTDGDGDLESAWYFTGSSGTTLTASPTNLIATVGTGSSSATTYFTPQSSPVTLGGVGDALRITWVFTPSNVNASSTSSSTT